MVCGPRRKCLGTGCLGDLHPQLWLSDTVCIYKDNSRNDRRCEEDITTAFHLLLRPVQRASPSKPTLLSSSFGSFSSPSARDSFLSPAGVVRHQPPRYPTSHTTLPSFPAPSKPRSLAHPLLAAHTLLQVCPSLNKMGSYGQSGRLPIKSCSRPRSPTPVAHRAHRCFRLGSPCYLRPALPPDYRHSHSPRC